VYCIRVTVQYKSLHSTVQGIVHPDITGLNK
jgi:hypothetical protein